MAFRKSKTLNIQDLQRAHNELVQELKDRQIDQISFDVTSAGNVPANGEQLTYDSTSGKFEPGTA